MKGEIIRIRGTVQGVGFRPWVWKLAKESRIRGRVFNDAQGVLVEAWGQPEWLDCFIQQLRQNAPPLSRIESIERLPPEKGTCAPEGFVIDSSREGETRTSITADAATCPECLGEIFETGNRRYGYPFTNCTHCGPRFSIIREVPYDRANTSMARFSMCTACQGEYDDPGDCRFHAQSNACADCGPRIWLEDSAGNRMTPEGLAVIKSAAQLIREGAILAIKGIGGIHLACDATSESAVFRLRQRKKRHHKAFALMARDISMISRYAAVDEKSARVLTEPAAPVVIMDAQGKSLASGINPGQNTLGFLLPYTPLHHLLMASLDKPVVLTSGNSSDEPQCISNEEAREKLGAIADFLLLHDREIVTRLDDSVVRVTAGKPRMLRRARGYAPEPVSLPPGFGHEHKVLAMGSELKNTFSLLREGKAVTSQHIGDLENASTFREYRNMLEHYQRLFDFEPDLLAEA